MCYLSLIVKCPRCGTEKQYIIAGCDILNRDDDNVIIHNDTKPFHCSTCGYEKYVNASLLTRELENEFSVLAKMTI